MTEDQKFQLVRSLFVHREDVIAKYYEKNNNWGPAYEDYKTKTYQPVNDGQLRMHINGVERRGVYSTALDNTCKWICADFDENENAFPHCLQLRDKLWEYGIPSYIERSNSGNGAHLWLFFEQPVHVAEARQLMLSALCLAGVPITGDFRKGGSGSRSMDRLTPTQDELTGKMLGNLVCLPLFGKAVEKGNTCFIDDGQQAYPDQWAFLQTIQKVNFCAANVQRLLQEEVELPRKETSTTGSASPLAEQFSFLYSLAATDSYFLQRRLREIRGCEAIQAGIQNANDFSEPAWQAVLSNLAVYGDGAALDLAHEFSKGYDMRAITNKEMSVYDPEETQKKFMHKIDYLQRNGIPSSCQSLSSNWECPKLKSCRKGFIAFYGLSQGEKYVLQAKELDDQTKATILQFNSKTLFRFYPLCQNSCRTPLKNV
ncbi:TOTE conflict system archaeo-eukaryotic primase domain-containing protein [Brevibacillus panacihumi]|uniref:TOTE conflict system archaeo-eukaryotic primase domain-containing protein n=1 Tax=Brevibacillus panacihumi TaxID=497735 RepID=UPI003D0475EC